MLQGHRTWIFKEKPVIISTGTVVGPLEAVGPIADGFDILHDDMWLKEASFEKAQQIMMEEACQIAIKKSPIEMEKVDFFISGDLTNQITPTTFAAKTLDLPFFGLYSACATSVESLALAALLINTNGANYVLSGTSSHNAAAERQFRTPTEYGGQKPPTAQMTVTGAGCALIAKTGDGPVITSATIGKIIDLGITDAANMGAAMAPAAVDTISVHLKERRLDHNYYDLIITGDLGEIGRKISLELLHENGINIPEAKYVDCGLTVYGRDQSVLAGGSGPACSAVVAYSHFINQLKNGKLKRILFVATGALHSPLSINQNDSIPCIAHAVSIETGSGLS